jgi:hypothetical protein
VVGKEDAPGIVVLQEWWGVDFEIKNHAVKISQLGPGFKALIPEYTHICLFLNIVLCQSHDYAIILFDSFSVEYFSLLASVCTGERSVWMLQKHNTCLMVLIGKVLSKISVLQLTGLKQMVQKRCGFCLLVGSIIDY